MQGEKAREVLPRGTDGEARIQIVREMLPILEGEADDLLVGRDRLGGDQVAEGRGAANGLGVLGTIDQVFPSRMNRI